MGAEAASLLAEVKSAKLEVAWNDCGHLTRVSLVRLSPSDAENPTLSPEWIPSRVLRFIDDLKDYFEYGAPFSRITWDDIAVEHWSDFQRKVYHATLAIPHGETRTY